MLLAFRSDKFAEFRNIILNPESEITAIDIIVEFLEKRSLAQWINYELIEMLAFDIGKISPPEFVDKLIKATNSSEIKKEVAQAFTDYMLQGSANVEKTRRSLPAETQVRSFIRQVEVAPDESALAGFSSLCRQCLIHFENTGEAKRTFDLLNDMFAAVQAIDRRLYIKFHYIVCDTITDLFSIDCTDTRIWIKWAASFIKVGDHKSAESLLWDAHRRRPENEICAFLLLKTMTSTRYNFLNRLNFANVCKSRYYFNAWFEIEWVRLNATSADVGEISTAVRDGALALVSLDERRSNNTAFRNLTSLLASVLSSRWVTLRSNPGGEYALREMMKKLKGHPTILAVLAHKAAKAHKNEQVINYLLSGSDTRKINQLAKLYAFYFGTVGVDQAISLLRQKDDSISQVHLARVLMHRGQDGDTDEAEELLRANLFKNPDNPYARTQLARLLYGKRDMPDEALELLADIVDDNEFAKRLYNTVLQQQPVSFLYVDAATSVDEEEVEEGGDINTQFDSLVYGDLAHAALVSAYRIPRSVLDNAKMRCLLFERSFGTLRSASDAQRMFDELRPGSQNEYVNFVVALEGRDNSQSVGALGARLAIALIRNDMAVVPEVIQAAPRLGAAAEVVMIPPDVASDASSYIITDYAVSWEQRLASGLQGSKLVRNIFRRPISSGFDQDLRANDIVDVIGAFITLDSIAA
jgi:tetratricopeptide (TPR) repeat protein